MLISRLTAPGWLSSRFLSALILFLPVAVALGQDPPRKSLATDHLEKYDDAPMYIFRKGISAATVSQLGAFTSYQVNVEPGGVNTVGDAANEPSIAVDPTNRNKMVIGWRHFDSVASNFRQAGYGYTSDGGVSWTFPALLQDNVFRSDPVLGSSATGQFFYLSLLQSFFDDMWRSLNGGQSFTRLGSATGGDKQWFTIDTTNGPGSGFQYQWWSTAGNNYGGRQFSRSVDGGFTWMNPINVPNGIVWGTLDVNANGDLFLGGVDSNLEQVWCVRSSDAQNAAVVPTFDLATPVNLGGRITAGKFINPEGIMGQVFLATDRSGGSTNNNVYMLASVELDGVPGGSQVMFVRSTDGGQSFSAPRQINDDPFHPNKWHWFGTFSVAPDGRLDAVWLDTRNAANNTDSQLFYSYSRDGGNNWSPNVAVSEPFNPFLGYPNQNKMGDYMTIVSDLGGGNVAYTATFNGEQDVYYVRVAPPTLKTLNLSTRARVLTGEQVLIAGFIITGTDPKRVIIRGIGPSINGVAGTLADPTLQLHQGNTALASNDNWKIKSDGTSQQAEIEATTVAPSNDLESAIVMTLNPGTYTATLSGKNAGTGVGVVEVYDLAPTANSQLANISTRGFVDTDDNAMIAGLIAGQGSGGAGAQVLVRVRGASLSSSGVQGALQDPTLALHDSNGAVIATNDDWKINDQTQQSQEALVRATTIAPTNNFESAIVATLPPGSSTAIVRGKNSSTGVGLVEVYNLQ
ncbi:MAG TPA: sialidase family protein [Chthoniobacterales bacterium]|nr:sialidase family protein [Chthoniobacterales bacterium]